MRLALLAALVRLARAAPRLFVTAAGGAVTLALFAGTALGSPFDPHGRDWEGLSGFVALAEDEGGAGRVVLTATLDLGRLDPADAVFIVHPERPLDGDELTAFMRAGGRVVLLDDYGTGDAFLATLGIRRVPLPRRPAEMLRHNPGFAIAEPASSHAVVRDLTRVVTNHATGLDQPSLLPLLVVRGDGEPDVVLALAGEIGRGRLIAIGDASIAMNSMLAYPDDRKLSLMLIRYALGDGGRAKPGGKLYLLTNAFDTTGAFGAASPAARAIAAARRALSSGVDEARRGDVSPGVAYAAALALGAGVIVWAGSRAGRAHRARQPRFVRPVSVAAQGGVAGRAAVLGAPATSRALAMLELKSALEEGLAARLGFDHPTPPDRLMAKIRSQRLLGEDDERALARLIEDFARFEARWLPSGGAARRPSASEPSDAEVVAASERLARLLAAVDAARRGTFGPP